MPKDKEGNKLTYKEYMARWAEGIRKITPYQQAKITFQNTWLMIMGIVAGIVFTFINIEGLWWLTVILVAALINTIIVQIGNYQKYVALRIIEEVMNEK